MYCKELDSSFNAELRELINKHSIENIADMPDFIMANMLCGLISQIGIASKQTLDWHGTDSICHPKEIKGNDA